MGAASERASGRAGGGRVGLAKRVQVTKGGGLRVIRGRVGSTAAGAAKISAAREDMGRTEGGRGMCAIIRG